MCVCVSTFTDDNTVLLFSCRCWSSHVAEIVLCVSKPWKKKPALFKLYVCVCVGLCVSLPECLSAFCTTLLTCSRMSALCTITHAIQSINNYWRKITETRVYTHTDTHTTLVVSHSVLSICCSLSSLSVSLYLSLLLIVHWLADSGTHC